MPNNKHLTTKSVMVATIALMACCFAAPGAEPSSPAGTEASLLDMPLEQLTEVAVGGTLTETDPHKAPGNVTVITSRDIALTPARNILDLLQIYVPSAMWLSHSSGPQIAMRGIVADRNYKYLVLVNGIRVNNGVAYGAISELSMWDLSDIDKIEIIRGPGSVTYGPGAIGGVISITTKNARTSPGVTTSAFYWDKYMARGASISYGYLDKNKGPDVYGFYGESYALGTTPDTFLTYGSGRANQALGQSIYLGDNTAFGGTRVYSGANPASYMGNFFGDPQYKALVDVDFKNGWRFWSRYTDARIPTNTYSDTVFPQVYPATGDETTFRTMRERQYLATLEKTTKLNEDWNLVSTFNYSSTEVKNVSRWVTSPANYPDNSQDNLRNIGVWCSEDKWFNRMQFNYDPKDNWKAAFGSEFSYTTFGPGWGKNRDNGLRIDDMISGPESDAYGNGGSNAGQVNSSTATYLPLGHGWKANQHALFGELNIDLTDKWSVLLSGRMDKQSFTDYMYSPRAALSYELAKDEFLKFSAQKSVRMNTEDELYKMDKSGAQVKPETLKTYEIMYQAYNQKGWDFMAGTFYNDLDAIAWNSVTRSSTPVGRLKVIGLELETAYRAKDFDFGANHSYVQQLSWELADGITTSGISNGDYYYYTTYQAVSGGPRLPVYLTSTGNDLNNYYNNITKIFGNVNLLNNKITLHGDTQIFWDSPGGQDSITMVRHAGTTNVGNWNHELDEKDAYGLIITGNASVTYHLNKSADITMYVQNIPITGDNKRYFYSSGSKTAVPEKTAWIEEPLTVGARFTARF
jgi:outer membrane receptor protein involved in Fe transport